jgi:hypothetical protein
MRSVVKDTNANLFLKNASEWTPYSNEAQRFPNGLTIDLHLENSTLPKNSSIRVVKLPS